MTRNNRRILKLQYAGITEFLQQFDKDTFHFSIMEDLNYCLNTVFFKVDA